MRTAESLTMKNLEYAFAGESMAHIKYLHFAKIARTEGFESVAKVFEDTAAQEVKHALSHAELVFPARSVDTRRALELAIEGETHEYTEMYPTFRREAEKEGETEAVRELDGQIEESREHAKAFAATLALAAKRFAALSRIEEKHANRYKETLSGVKS